MQADQLRAEVHAWLEEHRLDGLPPILDGHATWGYSHSSLLRSWIDRQRRGGWLFLGWPEQYGGRGFSPVQIAVVREEFAKAGVPLAVFGYGELMVGPTIMEFGTNGQKKQFLPRILSGEDRYCQGFSEPNAGSDLANVRTRGEVCRDEVVITGEKIWTSWAHESNMCFVLCRTSHESRRHDGLSYVLVPLDNQGVRVVPIRQMNGSSDFSSVYFDSVRVPIENVIGGVGNGWQVALSNLSAERAVGMTAARLRGEWEALVRRARERELTSNSAVRQQLAWCFSQVSLAQFLEFTMVEHGGGLDSSALQSVFKLFWSEYRKVFSSIAFAQLGPQGMVVSADEPGNQEISVLQDVLLSAPADTIESGTSEIQRRVIAERFLGLPRPTGDRPMSGITGPAADAPRHAPSPSSRGRNE